MDALRPQGIDRDAEGQRRIYAPRQTQHHPGKAVFVDVVTGALHEGAIDALFFTLKRRHITGLRAHQRIAAQSQIHRVHALHERGSAHGDPSVRIHYKRISVEDQFILTTDQIDEDQWNPCLGNSGPHDLLFALKLFIDLIRRGIYHKQHLGAGAAGLTSRLGLPHVLADQNSGPDAVELDYGRLRARREITLLVEHPIVGQASLPVIGQNGAISQHKR
jgi:hypothetical protein